MTVFVHSRMDRTKFPTISDAVYITQTIPGSFRHQLYIVSNKCKKIMNLLRTLLNGKKAKYEMENKQILSNGKQERYKMKSNEKMKLEARRI